jgi:hypothetical protein
MLLLLIGCGGGGTSNAPPGQVNFRTPTVGTQSTYSVQDITNIVNAAPVNYTYTKTYNTVRSDGTFDLAISCSPGSSPSDGAYYCWPGTQSRDATSHLQTQVLFNTSPATCTFSPTGEGLPFPLQAGQSWSADWTEACGGVPWGSLSIGNGLVVGIEDLTVTAGTFRTLKVQYAMVYTPGAPLSPVTSDKTTWIDVQTGGTVKTVTNYYSSDQGVGDIVQTTEQLQSYTGPTP